MTSLRRRLLVTAAAVLSVAFVLMSLALVFAFDRAVRKHAYAELEDRVDGLVRALRIENDGSLRLIRNLGDPRFTKVFGGLYWQVGSGNKVELASASLGDTRLPWDALPPRLGARRPSILQGPNNQELIAYESNLAFDGPMGQVEIRFMMAIDDSEMLDARTGFLEAIIPSLLAIMFLLVMGLMAFIRFGLAPLNQLQNALADVRSGRRMNISGEFPREIMPLVDEANAVISARAQDLIAARARAGDLAHAMKTPLAILDVHVRKLRGYGQDALADPIAEEVGNMDRVIRRELARARANFHAASHPQPTAAFPIIERTCIAISRLSSARSIGLKLKLDRSLSLLVDETDLMEMVGNLTENATKWARTTIQVTARRLDGGGLALSVEDDGPGLSHEEIMAVQTRGVRLDQSVQGTGLGLGIVRDLCELYGGELILGRSELGGLSATLQFPANRIG
ncbi:BaeS Signal transduction histidine kinase [Rhabdaerophilaceae bacterium]